MRGLRLTEEEVDTVDVGNALRRATTPQPQAARARLSACLLAGRDDRVFVRGGIEEKSKRDPFGQKRRDLQHNRVCGLGVRGFTGAEGDRGKKAVGAGKKSESGFREGEGGEFVGGILRTDEIFVVHPNFFQAEADVVVETTAESAVERKEGFKEREGEIVGSDGKKEAGGLRWLRLGLRGASRRRSRTGSQGRKL